MKKPVTHVSVNCSFSGSFQHSPFYRRNTQGQSGFGLFYISRDFLAIQTILCAGCFVAAVARSLFTAQSVFDRLRILFAVSVFPAPDISMFSERNVLYLLEIDMPVQKTYLGLVFVAAVGAPRTDLRRHPQRARSYMSGMPARASLSSACTKASARQATHSLYIIGRERINKSGLAIPK